MNQDAPRSELIKTLPKVELHLHIEGTFEPELMLELAERNNVKLKYDSVAAIRKAYQFSNLQDFLDIYYQGMSVLLKEQDFYQLADHYLARVAKDNVRHVEIFFDPQAHLQRGVDFDVVVNGIYRALEDGVNKYDISFGLILSFLRHLSEEDAIRTFQIARPHLDKFIGVGLDSSELGNPPKKFEKVFQMARDNGMLLMAHAGEEGPPEYIWQALDILKVDRIDHGNRAMEDKRLIARLQEEQIALTLCPLSNVKLRVIEQMNDHPMRKMLEKGLLATVNSDDPAYFGGYMNDNYLALAEGLDLSNDEIIQLAKNGITASFLNTERQSDLFREFDATLGKNSLN